MILLCIILLLSIPSVSAAETDDAFRSRMSSYVSEGNRQYDRSNRAGIMAMADSLEAGLAQRSSDGALRVQDSLEFTADRLKLLADWHYENGNYEAASFTKSEDFFRKALTIYSQPPFDNDTDLSKRPVLWRELAQLHYRLEHYREALDYTVMAENAYADAYLRQEFYDADPEWETWQDIRMQKALCLARNGLFEMAESVADSVLANDGMLPEEVFYESLRKKGKILILKAEPSARHEALSLYKRYFEWKRADAVASLSQDYWMRVRPFMADACLLEDEDPAFLYDIALFIKNILLRQQIGSLDVPGPCWKDIRRALPEGGAAIEFIGYEGGMAAVVLTKKKAPVWVPVSKDNVWSGNLVRVLDGCSSVYFSPDSFIHKMPIEYMLPEELEGTRLYRLSSTRRLLDKRPVSTASALIMGGADYGDGPRRFQYLKGSYTEAVQISRLRHNPADTLLTGQGATKQAFNELSGRYPMLCISTHGCFQAAGVPMGTDVKPCLSDDSLQESYLAMAGANNSPEGIMSAKEISALDLSGVDVAVLSACQTGLGYITADGVYGIQRGFFLAGAGCLVVSLWNVNDLATMMLMTAFQENLSKGMTLHDAFQAARESLSQPRQIVKKRFNPAKLASSPVSVQAEFSQPKYSNAFIMIDAIR